MKNAYLCKTKTNPINKMKRFKILLIIITLILSQNLFSQISEKKRAIIEAVKIGTFDEIKEKIQSTEDANVRDTKKIPILMWAIYLRDLGTVQYLVEKGAKVNEKARLYLDNNTYYGNNLSIASGEDKLDILKYLIETCKIPVDDKEFNPDDEADTGWTALEWACSNAHFEIAQYLISQKASININNENPLKMAISKQHSQLVKLLLDNGAKANTPLSSPLYYATFYQNLDIVKILIEKGAEIDSKVSANQTVFQYALEKGYLSIAAYLISQGAEGNKILSDGSYPIHICAKNGYFAILKQLLKKGGDVNAKTQKLSLTPLMYAAYNNQLNIAKYLIAQGADKNAKTTENQTALDFAKQRKNPDGKSMLVEMIKYLEEDVFTPLTQWEELNQEMVMYLLINTPRQ